MTRVGQEWLVQVRG